MDKLTLLVGILISAAIMWPCFQWYTWYWRAVIAVNDARLLTIRIDGIKQQFDAVNDERKLHHDTLTQAFDYINDNGPWGMHDIGMMELRSKLMDVLKDSSVGRV